MNVFKVSLIRLFPAHQSFNLLNCRLLRKKKGEDNKAKAIAPGAFSHFWSMPFSGYSPKARNAEKENSVKLIFSPDTQPYTRVLYDHHQLLRISRIYLEEEVDNGSICPSSVSLEKT